MNNRSDASRPTRIAIIGANFAGIQAALGLPPKLDVTVIDPGAHVEFLPNIHELVSGIKAPRQLRLSRSKILNRARHRFLNDRVTRLEPDQRRLTTRSGKRISFDLCLLAVGGESNTRGIPGAAELAMPFKTVADCRAIGLRLRSRLAAGRPVSVGIIGGGLEGIEALGEILRRYRHVPGLAIHLIERNRRLLPGAPLALGRDIQRICRNLPVHFHTGVTVEAVLPGRIQIKSDQMIPSDITIWTAGAKPPKLLAEAGLSPAPDKWAPVDLWLRSRYCPEIFIAGDAAQLPRPIARQAYHALDMGTVAAENILRTAAGRPLKKFSSSSKPILIAFGDLTTYMVLGRLAVASPALAGAKEAIYQAVMTRLDPPVTPGAALSFGDRIAAGIHNQILSPLTSPTALLRMAGVRVLY